MDLDKKYIDFEKDINRGRRAALKSQSNKKRVLMTFQATQKLREDANRKCEQLNINLSSYLRMCLERLIASPIEYKKQIDKEIKSYLEEIGE